MVENYQLPNSQTFNVRPQCNPQLSPILCSEPIVRSTIPQSAG